MMEPQEDLVAVALLKEVHLIPPAETQMDRVPALLMQQREIQVTVKLMKPQPATLAMRVMDQERSPEICLVAILLMAALRQVQQQVEMPTLVALVMKVMEILKMQEEDLAAVLMWTMVEAMQSQMDLVAALGVKNLEDPVVKAMEYLLSFSPEKATLVLMAA